jgi:hypothetical protein
MIIPISHVKKFGQNYFLIIDKNFSVQQLIETAEVEKNRYAGRLIKRIYDCLRAGNVNVIDEYNKYYALEYSGLSEFLYRRYNCSDSIIKIILENMNDDKVLELGDAYSGGDYNLGHFIMSEEILHRLNKFIK